MATQRSKATEHKSNERNHQYRAHDSPIDKAARASRRQRSPHTIRSQGMMGKGDKGQGRKVILARRLASVGSGEAPHLRHHHLLLPSHTCGVGV